MMNINIKNNYLLYATLLAAITAKEGQKITRDQKVKAQTPIKTSSTQKRQKKYVNIKTANTVQDYFNT